MTDLERRIKAKIPGEDTGIEVKRSLCAICSPGHHCGVDCYVKDGKIIRVEGTQEHLHQGLIPTELRVPSGPNQNAPEAGRQTRRG